MATKEESEYQKMLISNMEQGIDQSTHVSKIGEERWAQLTNVWYRGGLKQRRPGLKEFGSNLPLNGAFMGAYQVVWNDGGEDLIGLTTRDAYIYEATGKTWTFLTQRYNTGTVTTGGTGNRTVTLVGGSWKTSWPLDVMRIGFEQTDPDNVTTWYEVKQIDNATQLTLSEDGPTKSGVTYVLRICFSGDEDNTFSVTTITAPTHNQVFITNGIDHPQKYTSGNSFIDHPNLGNVTAAKCAHWYENRLILYRTVENAVVYPQRVRRSVKGDPEDFSGAGSGFNNLIETEDFIVWVESLKTALVVYKERSTLIQTYKGEVTSGEIYDFDLKLSNTGLLAPQMCVNLGTVHLFAGRDNFYYFDGVSDAVPVRGWVRNKIFGHDSEVNWGQVGAAFTCYIEESNEAHIFLPITPNNYCKQCYSLECDVEEFHYHEFPKEITGFGYYTRYGGVTWQDLSGTWAEQTWRWGDRVMLANAPMTLFGDRDGYIYSFDLTEVTDDGVTISQKYRTKQLESPGNKLRVSELRFKASGTTVSLYYSTDEGKTWTLLKTVSLSLGLAEYQINPHHTFQQVMYEFRSDTAFDLNWALALVKEVPIR